METVVSTKICPTNPVAKNTIFFLENHIGGCYYISEFWIFGGR